MLMNEIVNQIVNTTLNSFDFGYCVAVNVLTYITIKLISEKRKVTTWNKRVVFIVVALLLAAIYFVIDGNQKVIVNSIILAPVSWSWIFKPILKYNGYDYNKS